MLPDLSRRHIEIAFESGYIPSDAELLPIRQINLHLGLLEQTAQHLPDPRNSRLMKYSAAHLLQQKVYAIAQDYEDLDNHDQVPPSYYTTR